MPGKKDISIIIPCYNTKVVHLQEAINSVLAYKGKYSYEIIITDDGSTDENTLNLLSDLKAGGITILHQQNKGPAAARNNAVQYAHGEFLLCLDSDNKIKTGYIDDGINALRENLNAGVVYAKPDFMSEAARPGFVTGPFSIERLLTESYIDMCAVVRKKAWESAGGLDISLRRFEDWEFWIKAYKAGWQFIFIDKKMFEYRLREQSLMGAAGNDAFKKMVEYLYTKHWDLVYETFHSLYVKKIMYDNDVKKPVRSFLKYSRNKFLK